MRKLMIGLAAAMSLAGLAPLAASAATHAPVVTPSQSIVHQADWYCGPRCNYWRHRRWEHERWEHRRWEESHRYPYYGRYGYAYR
ncbi:MAG: hypothetical protein JO227_00285 [Acetobacteraceae bacterium]|nr:hypothetical protein [Acetobacteraceae bacterium]